jgi:hypothetical protein
VVDASAFGRLYVSPISLATLEENAGKTNTSLIRLEGHAVFGVERQQRRSGWRPRDGQAAHPQEKRVEAGGCPAEAGRLPQLHAREDGNVWYAAIGGTRYGPLRTLDDVGEFLPKET